jgi:hypothetical protein
MTDLPPGTNPPLCPICTLPLYPRAIWLKTIGNCHESCLERLATEEIAARLAADTEQGA